MDRKRFSFALSDLERQRLEKQMGEGRFSCLSDYIRTQLGLNPWIRVRPRADDKSGSTVVNHNMPSIRPFKHEQGKNPSLRHGVHSCVLDHIHRHSVADRRPGARKPIVMFSLREYPNGRFDGHRLSPHKLHIFNYRGLWICTINSGHNFDYYAEDFQDIRDRYEGVRTGDDTNPSEFMNHHDVRFRMDPPRASRSRKAKYPDVVASDSEVMEVDYEEPGEESSDNTGTIFDPTRNDNMGEL
jgi:hypothetical protein